MTHTYVEYIFDCPVHGWERHVYCWRAFDPELTEHWLKIEFTEKEVPWDVGQFEKFFEAFRQSAIEMEKEGKIEDYERIEM